MNNLFNQRVLNILVQQEMSNQGIDSNLYDLEDDTRGHINKTIHNSADIRLTLEDVIRKVVIDELVY